MLEIWIENRKCCKNSAVQAAYMAKEVVNVLGLTPFIRIHLYLAEHRFRYEMLTCFPPTSLHACFVKSFFVFFARWMHPDLNHFNRVRKWMHTWTIGSIGDDLRHRECMGSWVYGVHHTEVYGILNGNKATKEDMQKKKVPFRRKVGVGKNKPQSVGKWPLQWAV